MQQLGADPVLLLDLVVTDDPLVVDGVRVAQRDRHRDADRHRDLVRAEVRVPDLDRDRGLRRRPAIGSDRHRGHDPGQREGDQARPEGEAGPFASSWTSGFVEHRGQTCGVSRAGPGRMSPSTKIMTPTARIAASSARIHGWSTTRIVVGAGSPAWTQDGTPWPLASIARSYDSCGAVASTAISVSQPFVGTQLMPRSERRS